MIYETGVGGSRDSTNLVVKPIATGITSLAINHVQQLGNTIGQIAQHKAGIYKRDCPAYTVPQLPGAMAVLGQRAATVGQPFQIIGVHLGLARVTIVPDEIFQKQNASLAVAITAPALQMRNLSPVLETGQLSELVVHALETARLGGRFDTRSCGNMNWRLDVAHTVESLHIAAS